MKKNAQKRGVKLKKAADVQRLMARLINQVLRGEITAKDASKLGDLCKIQLKAIEQRDAEIRAQEDADMRFLYR